jgi:L-fucose mutarotase/ribose pyranase (RbsD/FucU family)
MAYDKFIPELWSEAIQRELEGSYVFAEDCNRQWEGEVKKKGDTVHILGVGKPTIKTLARENASNDIDGPEEIEDNEVILVIDQIRYFNYMVGDVDKAQAIGGLMDALSKETSEALADTVDTYIAGFAVDSAVEKLDTTAQTVTKDNVLDILDAAIQKLYENDVKNSTEVVVTISPRFYTLFKQAYIKADTNNSAMLKNGKVGMYGNVTVKMSNNVHKTDSGATDNIMIRTKRAIAFAQPLTHTEAYRPEKKFADAVKGFILYGAKVVRPKEIININVKYA